MPDAVSERLPSTATEKLATDTIARISRALQRSRGNKDEKTAWGGGMLLVGAGASISAGIPSGAGVARQCAVELANKYGPRNNFAENQSDDALRWLKDKGHAAGDVDWSNAYTHFFNQHYTDPTA